MVSAYLDRKISLGKAAELLGMTREELIEEFHKRGIPIRKLSKEDVIAEVLITRYYRTLLKSESLNY